jgi:hypothetical protein
MHLKQLEFEKNNYNSLNNITSNDPRHEKVRQHGSTLPGNFLHLPGNFSGKARYQE